MGCNGTERTRNKKPMEDYFSFITGEDLYIFVLSESKSTAPSVWCMYVAKSLYFFLKLLDATSCVSSKAMYF